VKEKSTIETTGIASAGPMGPFEAIISNQTNHLSDHTQNAS
jgi:hypothetical protein